MSYPWQTKLGEHVYAAAGYYDNHASPVAREGPSRDGRAARATAAFARAALSRRHGERPCALWCAALARGGTVDPIGDGHGINEAFRKAAHAAITAGGLVAERWRAVCTAPNRGRLAGGPR